MPSKLEEVKTEDAVQDECQSINDDELEKGRCSASIPVEQAETDGPVDFTIKADPTCSSPETTQQKELPDMAAFLASASAAVRNVTHFQVSQGSQGFSISERKERHMNHFQHNLLTVFTKQTR